MSVDRLTRVNELLRREIGMLLFRIMNEREFDIAAVTVTRVDASRNLRSAKVYVSVRNNKEKRQRMLAMLNSHAPEIQQWINLNIKLKYTPRLSFVLDSSIEDGDRVLRLLSELEEHP